MVMLTAAFDVSQDHPHKRFLVMAGFVSSAESWAEFEQEWRSRLAQDGLSWFHMYSFAHSINQFDGWRHQEARRRKLLSDILDITSGHAYQKFGCVIEADAFSMLNPETRDKFAETAIAAAGKFCVGFVLGWKHRERYVQKFPEFVFEDGDLGKGTLMKAVKELTGRDPIFRAKKDDPSKGIEAFTPLQASDILAYEIKKITDTLGQTLPDDFRFRFPYEQLSRIPGEPRILNFESVPIGDMLFKVDQYFEEHPPGKSN
jgi:hypothetical protein